MDSPRMESNMKEFLKIKILSLGLEAHAIRKQEERWLKKAKIARDKMEKWKAKKETPFPAGDPEFHFTMARDLYFHRIFKVRRDARASNLAYAFLRGKPYSKTEPYTHATRAELESIFKITHAIANRFYDKLDRVVGNVSWEEWLEGARNYLSNNTRERWSVKKVKIPWAQFVDEQVNTLNG